MKSVKSFIKAIGKNYYYDFLISPDSDDVDYADHFVLVEYENQNFYEKNLNVIRAQQEEIINEVKNLYENSLAEIYLKLSISNLNNFNAFIKFNIEAIKLKLKILKTDFYVDERKSRYCSILLDNLEIQNLVNLSNIRNNSDDILIKNNIPFPLNIALKYDSNKSSSIESFYYPEFHANRLKILSQLPFSLFHISRQFILELIKIESMIIDLQEAKETNPKIKWTGKKTHIGFILGTLAQNGYVDAPKGRNGEINYTAFAKLLRQNFEVEVTEDTLRKYLNPDDEKFIENQKTFEKEGFNIPHSKMLG